MTAFFDLTEATAHDDPYVWLAVFAAHGAVGAALWGAFAILGASPRLAAFLASAAYFSAWEIAIQGLGAGIPDAVLDWAAVTFGAVAAWGLWVRSKWLSLIALIFWGIVAAIGVRGRS